MTTQPTTLGQAAAFLDRTYTGESRAALTADTLANDLYWHIHCRVDDAAEARARFAEPADAAVFVERLAAVNAGRGSWQRGWTIAKLDSHGAIARAFSVNFRVAAADIRPDGGTLVEGAPAIVRIPNEYRNLSFGYYTALGNTDHDPVLLPTVRVYWNVGAEDAPALVAGITRLLNVARVPFRFKVPSHPDRFMRADSGVLYLPSDRIADAWPALKKVHSTIGSRLRAHLSPLIKPIARGVGAAHDPGDGSSYGTHRCARMAAALLSEAAVTAPTPAARLAAAEAHLRSDGIDPERPWLAPGAEDNLRPFTRASR